MTSTEVHSQINLIEFRYLAMNYLPKSRNSASQRPYNNLAIFSLPAYYKTEPMQPRPSELNHEESQKPELNSGE